MSAVVLLVVCGVWLWIGRFLWRHTLQKASVNSATRLLLGLVVGVAWVAMPFADEWFGARDFRRLCDEMPEAAFSGPVSVGPGLFFDDKGNRLLWGQEEIEAGSSPLPKNDIKLAYAEGTKFQDAWRTEFRSTTQSRRIQDWPIPVLEETVTYVQSRTGRVVLISHWRGSPGGWIKRAIGWGSHSPYQCSKNSTWPHEWAWIAY